MCIIVDANAAHDLSGKTPAGKPVLIWLLGRQKNVGLVVGGKLLQELKNAGLQRTLVELSAAGRLHRVSEQKLLEVQQKLESSGKCKSNDVHVVALALVSRCTVVFSRDKELGRDLHKNCEAGRKISIYKTPKHKHLLTECKCADTA